MDDVKLKQALRIAEENNNTISFNILKRNTRICTRETNEIIDELRRRGVTIVIDTYPG